MMLCNVLVLHPSFYGFLVLNIWWPQDLSIIMNVNYFHGEKHFLCKFVISMFFLCPPIEDVIIFILKLSKFIVFIFEPFQSPKLIKYVLYSRKYISKKSVY
jgi:hypothetical protein